MTSTTTEARPRGSRTRPLTWIVPTVCAIAVFALALVLTRATPDRTTLRIDNRTGVAVRVQVSDASRGDGWLGLGTIDARTPAAFEEVIDQGDTWRFRLSVGGDEIGELRRTAAELDAADHRLTIPDDAADQLPERRR